MVVLERCHLVKCFVPTLIAIALCGDASEAIAQASVPPGLNRPQKTATAVRVPSGTLRIDGRPDEAIWTSVPALTDFVQKDPVEGAAPTDQLTVRIAYDDEALY